MDLEVVSVTEEQKFHFDLKGWVLIPGVLAEAEIAAIRAHLERFHHDKQSLPPEERFMFAGPCQVLLDHPAILDVLRETLAPDMAPDSYGFRLDQSMPLYREYDEDGLYSHAGGGLHGKYPEVVQLGPFAYNCRDGQIFSGLTRALWELTEVVSDGGGTLFMSGSHKNHFPVPEAFQDKLSSVWESYTCPPGSVVVFAESLHHAGGVWKNKEDPRYAISNCYAPIEARRMRYRFPDEAIDALEAKRQTLFRDVWWFKFEKGKQVFNEEYNAEDNRGF